jgi:hypothetical protein
MPQKKKWEACETVTCLGWMERCVSGEYEESKASPYTRSPKAGVSDVTWASAVLPVYF